MEARIEDIISSVTSNPELFEKISSTLKENDGDISKSLGDVVSLISESASDNNENKVENDKKESTEEAKEAWKAENKNGEENTSFNNNQFFDILSSLGSSKGGGFVSSIGKSLNKCTPLLIALKPYLSHSRCELIDTMIKISKLSSIVNLTR